MTSSIFLGDDVICEGPQRAVRMAATGDNLFHFQRTLFNDFLVAFIRFWGKFNLGIL